MPVTQLWPRRANQRPAWLRAMRPPSNHYAAPCDCEPPLIVAAMSEYSSARAIFDFLDAWSQGCPIQMGACKGQHGRFCAPGISRSSLLIASSRRFPLFPPCNRSYVILGAVGKSTTEEDDKYAHILSSFLSQSLSRIDGTLRLRTAIKCCTVSPRWDQMIRVRITH